jgi:excisionase family DNA binding protein
MYTPGMAEPIRWMSTREASERLGVTLRTLYRFIDEGQLAAYKFGRVIRIKEADVDAFIESARIPPRHPRAPVPRAQAPGRRRIGDGERGPRLRDYPSSVSSRTAPSRR